VKRQRPFAGLSVPRLVSFIANKHKALREGLGYLRADPTSGWWRIGLLLDDLAEADAARLQLVERYRQEQGGTDGSKGDSQLGGGRTAARGRNAEGVDDAD
jgi:hypothetical protein